MGKFETGLDFQDWITENSKTKGIAILVRMSLRAFPMLHDLQRITDSNDFREELLLASLRCFQISSTFCFLNKDLKENWEILNPIFRNAVETLNSLMDESQNFNTNFLDTWGEPSELALRACISFGLDNDLSNEWLTSSTLKLQSLEEVGSDAEIIEPMPLNNLEYWNGLFFANGQLNANGPKPKIFELFESDMTKWSFWREWYQGFLDGKPLDWDLQREVALIPDEDWDKGPAHIASLIDQIWEPYKLKEAIKRYEVILPKDEISRHGIGGNNPPLDIEYITSSEQIVSLSYTAINVLKDESEKETPDKTLIQKAVKALKIVLVAIATLGSAFFIGAAESAGSKYGEDVVKSVIEHATSWYNHLP